MVHVQVCLTNPFTDTNPLQTARYGVRHAQISPNRIRIVVLSAVFACWADGCAGRRIVEGDFKPIEDQNNNYSEVPLLCDHALVLCESGGR